MKDLKINKDDFIFKVNEGHNIFNQLAVKIDMNCISDQDYFKWLDSNIECINKEIKGLTFLEKEGVRENPPLNTAVYYDTENYKLLPTGALLRTSCNIKTHAFCAFKMPEDHFGNRLDRRHVFEGIKKKTIQTAPYSSQSIEIVRELLNRTDIDHPGIFLKKEYGITGNDLIPSVVLFGRRSTFYVKIDDMDTLRCSIDRSEVMDYRKDLEGKNKKIFREVEISIYPRISKDILHDSRVIETINYLVGTLCKKFETKIIYDIKYQRAAKLLSLD